MRDLTKRVTIALYCRGWLTPRITTWIFNIAGLRSPKHGRTR